MGDVTGIDLRVLAQFLVVALLVELTPGPNMTWLATLAVREGWRAGAAAVAGVTLGLAVLALAAALGLAALLDSDPRLIQAIDWAGVAVMAALTWDAVRTACAGPAVPPAGLASAFVRGFVTNVLNAKALAFFAAVPARFLRAGAALGAGLGVLLTGYLVVAIVVHAAVVLAAARAGARAAPRMLAPLAAVGLAGVTIWLAVRAAAAP